MTDMSEKHAHCWHYMGGYTNGLAVAGEDNFRCCKCGDYIKKTWTMRPDPAHGGFCELRVRVYEGGWKP